MNEDSNCEEITLNYDVSVIIPIYNGDKWIDECFQSILNQTAILSLRLEVCICNDASTDNTSEILEKWKHTFNLNNIHCTIFNNLSGFSKGVGYSKNRAFEICRGKYLCFLDVDDIMLPNRILKQYNAAKCLPNTVLLGCRFRREPVNSTVRYTRWANSLSKKQLNEQIYTSHGPTIIMPTWFCHRDVFRRVNGFSESGKGTPEDLIFFYKHLDLDGSIYRINEELLIYRYYLGATTFSIKEQTIWNIRLQRLEEKILIKWPHITIWNAGKQGRKFYNSLKKETQQKVIAMCDVDKNKIGKFYQPFNEKERIGGRKIQIIHYSKALKPFVICVKLDMTNGIFEMNLDSLNLKEGEDYVYFS